jgi:hypothetical protein
MQIYFIVGLLQVCDYVRGTRIYKTDLFLPELPLDVNHVNA